MDDELLHGRGALLNSPQVEDLARLCGGGLQLHRSGRLAEAAAIYEQVLARDPCYFDALHFLGVHRIQTGQLEAAVELIGRAVAVRDDSPDAFGNLANALNSLGRSEAAIAAADHAIALAPGFAEAHGNRAQALQRLGRLDEALLSYEQAVALKPSAKAQMNLAVVLQALGRAPEALGAYDRALMADPSFVAAWRGRGQVQREMGRYEDALQSFHRALAASPDDADALVAMGAALRALNRLDEALASFDRAIGYRPSADAFYARGNVLGDMGRHDEALAAFERASELRRDYPEAYNNRVPSLRALDRPLEALASAEQALVLRPDYAQAHANRAGALYDLRRLDEALAACDRALALDAALSAVHDNRGVLLYEMRRFDEAMESFDQALALCPDDPDAHHHQAMCRLMLGDFATGWAQYEWRWRTRLLGWDRPQTSSAIWLGEQPVAGRTVLIRAEQGLGDSLQFCRFAPQVAGLGAKVVLEVQPGLERLLASLPGISAVVTRGQPQPAHDVHVHLMSLPHALGQAGASPRVDGRPYLDAEPEEVAAWADRLATTHGLRVGLCWAGGIRPGQFVANSIDARRSLPLAALAPLAEIEGVTFFSLQKGPPAEQLTGLDAGDWRGSPIVDLTSDLTDFAATAALAANLDLVITCDTAIAHLAGAIGKPVWILNRHDACWRWMDGRDESAWYDAARLFRQPEPGEWGAVVAEVKQALSMLAKPAKA